ncbi:MAG: AsmA-like C-terminal region-containing protein [Verrucomicrobiota bacterium]
MHKLSKRFLLAASTALAAAVLAGLSLVAASIGGREQMETALRREWGVPVKISALHYNLWSGFRATGVSLELPPSGEGGAPSSLNIPSITASVGFWPLFSGHVIIRRLVFRDPSAVWVQGGGGDWSLRLKQEPLLPPVQPGVAAGTGVAAEAAPSPTASPKPPKAKKPPRPAPERNAMEFQIQSIRVKNALLRFVDRRGRTVALVEGVTVHCPLELPNKAHGTLAVNRVTLRNGGSLEAFETPFLLENGLLAFPALKARLAEGSVWGSGTVGILPGLPPFTLDLLFDGVDLNRLLTDLGQDSQGAQRSAGVVHGNLDLYGTAGDTQSLRGAAQLQLRNGRMEQFPLLQMIGKVLLIEELQDVELRQAQLDLRADEGKVFVDSLVMESPNLRLMAQGTSEWDGKLALAARLDVNAKVRRQLPGWVDANFHPAPGGGDHREIAFAIGGTLARPNTDLMQVMVGRKVGDQLLNLWKSLTGKPKKKSDDKKKKPDAPVPAEESGEPDAPPQAGLGN